MAKVKLIPVTLGEIAVSKEKGAALVCYGLGSCVAICVYEPLKLIAGLFHCVLPQANGTRLSQKYADVGIPKLLEEMEVQGASLWSCKAKLVGGATVLKVRSMLDIGSKNVAAATNMLKKHSISIDKQECGGNFSRTVKFYVESGKVVVSRVGGEEMEL